MAETTKIFESHLVKQALKDSVLKLNPVYMIKNPIMFVVSGHAACLRINYLSGFISPRKCITAICVQYLYHIITDTCLCELL